MKNLVNKPQKSRERSSYLKRFIGIIFACLLMQNSSAQIIFPVSLSIIEFDIRNKRYMKEKVEHYLEKKEFFFTLECIKYLKLCI